MKVLIVGAGKAGAFNKTTRVNGQIVYRNHLDVLLALKTTEINIVDNSLSVLRKLKRKIKANNINYFKNLNDVISNVNLAIIATPPKSRIKVLEKIYKLGCKTVIIEKPLALKIQETTAIINFIEKKKLNLIVNYPRRYDNLTKKYIHKTKLPNKIVCFYGKGVLNYGSHLIDFLFQILGKFDHFSKLCQKSKKSEESPSFFILTKSKVPIYVIGLDDIKYDQFEINLFYENEKVEIRNGGLDVIKFYSKKDFYIQSYSHLKEEQNVKKIQFTNCFSNLYKNLIKKNKINQKFEFQKTRDILYIYKVIEKINS